LSVSYSDTCDSSFDYGTFYIYQNATTTPIYTEVFLTEPFSGSETGLNRSLNWYSAVIVITNHNEYGTFTLMNNFDRELQINESFILEMDYQLGAILGTDWGVGHPVGWINVFILIIALVVAVSFGKYWQSLALAGLGIIIACLETVIGIPGLSAVQVAGFASFCVIYGGLVEIAKRKRGKFF